MFRCTSSRVPTSPSLVGILLMQRNNNGKGPKYSAPTDPRTVHHIQTTWSKNPYFNVDERGRYWLIKPDKERHSRSRRDLVGEVNSFRDGRKYFKHIGSIVDEEYEPRLLDRQREELISKKMKLSDDNDGDEKNSSSSALTSKTTTKSITLNDFHTRPIKVIDALEQRRFGPLLFHHFLHGVRGLDNSDRRPLLVRKSFARKNFFDTNEIRKIQDEVLTMMNNTDTMHEENSSKTMLTNWADIFSSTSTVSVPFAVRPHSKLQVATIIVSSGGKMDEKKQKQKHQQQFSRSASSASSPSSLMNPVTPFSRAAKHARLTGKPIGFGAANRDQVLSEKTMEEENNNKVITNKSKSKSDDDEKECLAWNPDEIYSTEETILTCCAGGGGGTSDISGVREMIESTMFEITLTPPSPTTTSTIPLPSQKVILGARDCLYIPRGWKVQVSTRRNDNDDETSHEKDDQHLLPLLFRFSYSPVFPETGPIAAKSSSSSNIRKSSSNSLTLSSSHQQQYQKVQKVRYVASDYISSFGDFYHNHVNLNNNSDHTKHNNNKMSVNGGGMSDERMGVLRPMNL